MSDFEKFQQRVFGIVDGYNKFRDSIVRNEAYEMNEALAGHYQFIFQEVKILMKLGEAHPETIKTMINVLNEYMQKGLTKLYKDLENDRD